MGCRFTVDPEDVPGAIDAAHGDLGQPSHERAQLRATPLFVLRANRAVHDLLWARQASNLRPADYESAALTD